jgi:glycosyltransferase involved in cell wall biosynthesis
MNLLLLEPYCGGSHQAWAEGYAAHSTHAVALLTLPARFWKWRMQGGAVTLAAEARALDARPDLILASDMVNLPAFLSLMRDRFSDVPVALYCHENQLTYPLPPGEKRDLTYGMINWLSMLAADRVFFNSRYHLDDWFEELPRLLNQFPEYTHVHRIPEVRDRATILPVGCDLRRFGSGPGTHMPPVGNPPIIVWNQRWEYDKAPQVFLQALYCLAEEGVDFRVILAGKSYLQTAAEFALARERLSDRVIHFGLATSEEYSSLLRRADVVVSTAIHEFFGVAIVEAVYCGCFPVLPRRLAYPEIIPSSHHEMCLYDDFGDLVAKLRWALENPRSANEIALSMHPAMARYDWSALTQVYDEAMVGLVRPG